MDKAREFASSYKTRKGYHQIKNKFGHVVDEIPLDFPDPASWKTDEYWLEYLALMWKASGTQFPPTIDEVRWRDRKLDEEVAGYRMMLDFFIKYADRPEHLRDEGGVRWDQFLNGNNGHEAS